MIVYETGINQTTVEIKHLHVSLRPSIMNRSHTISDTLKCPKIQNVKLTTIEKCML